MSDLLAALVDAPCPVCGYAIEFELIDAVAHASRWCPCCRTSIQLTDDAGEVNRAASDIDRALERLGRSLS